MGSVDIPPFLRQKQKEQVESGNANVPPFLKKKDTTNLKDGSTEPSPIASDSEAQSSSSEENKFVFKTPANYAMDDFGHPQIEQANGEPLAINKRTLPVTPYQNNDTYITGLQERIKLGKTTDQDELVLKKNRTANYFNVDDEAEIDVLSTKYEPALKGYIKVDSSPDEKLAVVEKLRQNIYGAHNNQYKEAEYVPEMDRDKKDELERLNNIKEKLASEKTASEIYPVYMEAVIRNDESGNLWNKFKNRLLAASVSSTTQKDIAIDKETVDRFQKLPVEFSIGLNKLKYTNPSQFERYSKYIAEGQPISESDKAIITAQGIDIKEDMAKFALANGSIDKMEYTKQQKDIQKSRYENIVGNKETLRAVLSSGIANKADEINQGTDISPDANSLAAKKIFGHRWNYSDEEIENYGKQYAQSLGIDPNDARVKDAIKYLQDNEGAMIMQNSIAKDGYVRDFGKGFGGVVRGIGNFVENAGKSNAERYAEGQSQGNVNVSEQRLDRIKKSSIEDAISAVMEGTGQFAAQALLAGATSGAIGAGVKAVPYLSLPEDAIATYVTAYAQSYDSNKKTALGYTADDNKANATAAVMSGLEGATELFLSPLEIAQGIGKKLFNKQTLAQGITKIISDDAILNKNAAVKAFIKGTLETAKVAGAEIGEEEVTQIADYASNALLNPDSKSFKDRDLMQEIGSTAYQTGLSMALPALTSGVGAGKVNNFTKGALLIAGQNRQQMIDGLDKMKADGKISPEKYNEKVAIINTAAKANDALPIKANGEKLNVNEKANYVYSRVAEGVLNKKLEATDDEAEKAVIEKKIKNLQAERVGILESENDNTADTHEFKINGKEATRADVQEIMDKGQKEADLYDIQYTGNDDAIHKQLQAFGGTTENNVTISPKSRETVLKESVNDLYDRLEGKAPPHFLDPLHKEGSIEQLANQALTAPNSIKNAVGEDLAVELIARNTTEDINKSIEKWQTVADKEGENVDPQERKDAKAHIAVLKKGLEVKADINKATKPVIPVQEVQKPVYEEPVEGLSGLEEEVPEVKEEKSSVVVTPPIETGQSIPLKSAEQRRADNGVVVVAPQSIPEPVTIGKKQPVSTVSSEVGKNVETDKAVMEGIKTDFIENEEGQKVKLPSEGFLVDAVYLKEGQEKGKGSGQELYQKALDEHGTLYSHFPISEDAMRVQDKLVQKGIAKIETITLSDGTQLRKISKPENKPITNEGEAKDEVVGEHGGVKIVRTTNVSKFYDAIKNALMMRSSDRFQAEVHPIEYYQKIIDTGGSLYLAENGMFGAFVQANGYMGSLFKHPDSNTQGVAKILQKIRVSENGGGFFDAYATHLEKMYIKNGFRPVARLKFNEDYAPDGWQDSNLKDKPDVVFFAYDPDGKYKAGDGQYFDDWDKAYIFARDYGKEQSNTTAATGTDESVQNAISNSENVSQPENVAGTGSTGSNGNEGSVQGASGANSSQSPVNDSLSTQNFFSNTVNGANQPNKSWRPLLPLQGALLKAYDKWKKFRGGFDSHIETSIPGFRDIQIRKINAITEVLPKGGTVIDLGGSEGGFGKTITEINPKIKTVNLDMNPDMQAAHEKNPVKGADFVKAAFGEDVQLDDGTVVKRHVPKEKADVVHESMMFQFIMPERKGFIDEIADHYVKPDGVVIIEEKVIAEKWAANESKKDNDFKSNYYDASDIKKKSDEVLVGMKSNQAGEPELLKALSSRFKYVYQYWDSGNFKGYIASNDKSAAQKMLSSIGDTTTDFTSRKKLTSIENGKQKNTPKYFNEKSNKKIDTKENDFDTKIDAAADKIIKALTPKGMEGVQANGLTVESLVRGAANIVKTAYRTGADISKAIEEAVQHIKDKWQDAFGTFDEAAVREQLQSIPQLKISDKNKTLLNKAVDNIVSGKTTQKQVKDYINAQPFSQETKKRFADYISDEIKNRKKGTYAGLEDADKKVYNTYEEAFLNGAQSYEQVMYELGALADHAQTDEMAERIENIRDVFFKENSKKAERIAKEAKVKEAENFNEDINNTRLGLSDTELSQFQSDMRLLRDSSVDFVDDKSFLQSNDQIKAAFEFDQYAQDLDQLLIKFQQQYGGDYINKMLSFVKDNNNQLDARVSTSVALNRHLEYLIDNTTNPAEILKYRSLIEKNARESQELGARASQILNSLRAWNKDKLSEAAWIGFINPKLRDRAQLIKEALGEEITDEDLAAEDAGELNIFEDEGQPAEEEKVENKKAGYFKKQRVKRDANNIQVKSEEDLKKRIEEQKKNCK